VGWTFLSVAALVTDKNVHPVDFLLPFAFDEHALEERTMPTLRNQVVALFVDRQSQQWIVRDQEGKFWTVPSVENAWDHRQPFQLAEETDLEPVPGHYKHMLGVPF
jgi:hypothetical protein